MILLNFLLYICFFFYPNWEKVSKRPYEYCSQKQIHVINIKDINFIICFYNTVKLYYFLKNIFFNFFMFLLYFLLYICLLFYPNWEKVSQRPYESCSKKQVHVINIKEINFIIFFYNTVKLY